jgi:hypothetical protein
MRVAIECVSRFHSLQYSHQSAEQRSIRVRAAKAGLHESCCCGTREPAYSCITHEAPDFGGKAAFVRYDEPAAGIRKVACFGCVPVARPV